MTMDWSRWPNFAPYEFQCRHTGRQGMNPEFMDRLQQLRTAYGKPLTITSGYRDKTHPIESIKATPGAHTYGRAADISIAGPDALKLIRIALDLGFTGVGVQQKGTGRFIHLDDLVDGRLPRPAIWSY